MSNLTDQIGKYVINSENGIGEIVEVTKMSGDEEFFRVMFKKSEAVNYFSTKVQKNYRMISSKDTIEEAIGVFNESHHEPDFKSVQESIVFYKKELKSSNIKELARILSLLNTQEEVHTGLKTLFEKTLKSFVREIDFVLDIKNIEAWSLLGLKKNNK